jgi:hypothetical protein
MTMKTTIKIDRDILFEILLDSDADGLQRIHGAPIHCVDDFLRARRELSRLEAAPVPASAQSRLRPA